MSQDNPGSSGIITLADASAHQISESPLSATSRVARLEQRFERLLEVVLEGERRERSDYAPIDDFNYTRELEKLLVEHRTEMAELQAMLNRSGRF